MGRGIDTGIRYWYTIPVWQWVSIRLETRDKRVSRHEESSNKLRGMVRWPGGRRIFFAPVWDIVG